MADVITSLVQTTHNVVDTFVRFLRQHHPDVREAIKDVNSVWGRVGKRHVREGELVEQQNEGGVREVSELPWDEGQEVQEVPRRR